MGTQMRPLDISNILTAHEGDIRDDKDTRVLGFYRKLPAMSVLMAEARALKEGLTLVKTPGVDNLNIQVDAQLLASYLEGNLLCEKLFALLLKTTGICLVTSRRLQYSHI